MFRCSRQTVIGAVVALALLAASAPAALADSSQLITAHPDLIAAQAISSKQVLACFDQILATPFSFTDASFFLQGYTESRRTGTTGGLKLSTETSAGGGFCVVAAFTGSGDARGYSTLAITAGAVTASVPGGGGAANAQNAVPLLGSTLPNITGGTLHPQLVGAAASGSNVTFTFNEPLTGVVLPTGFGFYNPADNALHLGTVTSFTPGTAVTVTFNAGDASLLGSASRFVAGEGAVIDANAQTNPLATIGGATKLIDLAATTAPVPASGPLAYRYDFSQALPSGAAVCPAKFALYDATGTRYSPAAGTPTISSDRKSVSLTFAPDAGGGDPAQVTLATVAGDAVDAAACGAATPAPLNSDGAVGFPGVNAKAGTTSGPDLVSFQINKTTGIVAFAFDAPVAAGTIVPGSFHLVDKAAALTSPPNQAPACLLGSPAPVITLSPSNTVNVNFAVPGCLLGLVATSPDLSAVQRAIGVTVDEGAVADAATAVVNPLGSLGIAGSAAPTGPTGPTTPPAPVVPAPPAPILIPPPKPLVKKPCTRTITLHLLSTVSHNLRSATVTINGKKVTVSKKLTVTVAFAKYTGVKSVVIKIKGRLKNGHTTSKTKTYKNKC